MKGIIGAGFGLYGHLPAAARLDAEKIIILKRYKPVFDKRPELQRFENRILWEDNEAALVNKADTIVLSLWPKGQEEWLTTTITHPNIQAFILEKPLGISPQSSAQILNNLILSKKSFRINYSFLYTSWYKSIRAIFDTATITGITIRWNFLAHHYRHDLQNWKRTKSLGGSVIRFYGIHLLALLAALQFSEVAYSNTTGFSNEDLYTWDAGFKNKQTGLAEVLVNSKSTNEEFSVEVAYTTQAGAQEHFSVQLKDPFSDLQAMAGDQDQRVELLERVHASLSEKKDNVAVYRLYEYINTLWHNAERLNINTIH